MITTRQQVSGLAVPVFDQLNLQACELRRQGHAVLNLGQAVPDFPPPDSACAALRDSLSEPDTHLYSSDAGLLSLRGALSDALRTNRIDVSPEQTIVTAGANQAFALAVLTLLNPGDEVLLPSPYFANHDMMLRLAGVRPVEVVLPAERAFRLVWSDIEPYLTPATRAVVFCTPSNPTGAVIDAVEGEKIVRELARRDVLVISDETYMKFVYRGSHWSAASGVDWTANVIVIGSFSKSFGMTGWRVGYLLADESICAMAMKVQDAMLICAPVPSQKGVEAAIRFDWNYVSNHLALFAERRRILSDGVRHIPRLSWSETSGGLFAFVRVGGCRDSAGLAADILQREKIVTIPGSAFGRTWEDHLRFSFGAAKEPDIIEAIARLARYFGAEAHAR